MGEARARCRGDLLGKGIGGREGGIWWVWGLIVFYGGEGCRWMVVVVLGVGDRLFEDCGVLGLLAMLFHRSHNVIIVVTLF